LRVVLHIVEGMFEKNSFLWELSSLFGREGEIVQNHEIKQTKK